MTELRSIVLRRDELNRSIGGGLPTKSLILIEGKDGAGKSILVQRLAFGLLQNNVKVTYISTELTTQDFIEQMISLDYDIKYHLLEDKLLFLPMFPFLGNVTLRENFMDRLLHTPKIFEKEVIIFDTLSFLLINDSMPDDKSFEIIRIFKKLTSSGKTIIVNVDPDHLNSRLLTLLRAVSDVYFSVEVKTFAGALVRVINVLRFKRPGENVLSAIPFKVETGKGLAIEIASFS